MRSQIKDLIRIKPSRKVTQLTPFYGYPAHLVAEWCAVDIKTAQRWKRGTQRPSPGHLKLFKLYADMRVMDPILWPDGWAINRDVIVDPEGKRTTASQLRAYALVYQLCRELAKKDHSSLRLLNYYIQTA